MVLGILEIVKTSTLKQLNRYSTRGTTQGGNAILSSATITTWQYLPMERSPMLGAILSPAPQYGFESLKQVQNKPQALENWEKILLHLPILELFLVVGVLFWPYGGEGGKITPSIGDLSMGRYYHVVIVAILNIALPPWVVSLVEYLLRLNGKTKGGCFYHLNPFL